MSLLRRIFLLDVIGNIINPATEDKQDTIISTLQARKFADTGNSTTTPLAAGATFTGDWIDTDGYVQAIAVVITSHNAAADGLRFELSDDGVNVLHAHVFTPTANAPNGHHYPSTLESQYFRVKYTNGGTLQTTFVVSTHLLKSMAEEGHVHPVNYVIDDDHPVAITRAILTGKTAAGAYSNVALTNGSNLKVSLEELEAAISVNSNTQLRTTLFDTTGNEPAMIEQGGAYAVAVSQRPVATFSVQLSIENLGASADYILVDLSDTVNFPHTLTGLIQVSSIHLDLNPDTAFRGDIQLGYLKNVDATDGDFVLLKEWHQDLAADPTHSGEHFFPNELICSDAYHLGAVTANDVAFQTDVALTSPAGTSVSGTGDLALRVIRIAGNIDIGITLQYRTET